MKIYVQGLWHLGSVTAACLASVGHDVVGLDFDENVINSLNNGSPTIFEPNLKDMVKSGLISGKLQFISELNYISDIDFLWVTYDTPVDEDDNADINFVINQIKITLPSLSDNAVVMISSQMPIGSIKSLEKMAKDLYPYKNINFACSPENLRLGNAINIFLKPDRIIVGIRSEYAKLIIKQILDPITDKIEWMSVESAEMTKHAINAFLATSVVFANEIASICEMTGADAKEVERGLKSEQRIGKKAYLSPGGSFSGGTLARDIAFLKNKSKEHNVFIPLLESVKTSNDFHKYWACEKIIKLFPDIKNINIAVWGLTYKPGTDTLRRSLSVEICDELINYGANIRVHDPIVKDLPKEWDGLVSRFDNALESLIGTKILLIGTECVEYKEIFKNYNFTDDLTIIDTNRFLIGLEKSEKVNYISVGTPQNQ